MLAGRTLIPLIVNAIAWACLLQWPWGETLFPAYVVIAVVHLVVPLWSSWIDRSALLHRAFAKGPLLIFVIDVTFLVVAWRDDLWGDLTAVFVPVLGGIALLALVYSAGVMTLLARLRARRDR